VWGLALVTAMGSALGTDQRAAAVSVAVLTGYLVLSAVVHRGTRAARGGAHRAAGAAVAAVAPAALGPVAAGR
jgi:hypothetical protein